MKSILLFSTKLKYFLTELPPVALLILACFYNDNVEGLYKLYPLIVFLSLVIIFIVIFFFRAVVISNEQIRTVGLFSTKDKALINKGKYLCITKLSKNKIRVELFDTEDDTPVFSWSKKSSSNINIFRAKANGGIGKIKKIMRHFGLSAEDADSVIGNLNTPFENEFVRVHSEKGENDELSVRILFLETI